MERFRGKKVLIIGVGKTGFALIDFFNNLQCEIRITDIKPIFDLNRQIKKLRKINPVPLMTFGEHKDEDFLEADIVVFSASVDPNLPQLKLAQSRGKFVYSEFELANLFCDKPIIAVCGSYGRTTVANMIGYTLKVDGKNVFVGGTSEAPFINLYKVPKREEIDYVIVEASALQLQSISNFKPHLVIFTNISNEYPETRFRTIGDYIETSLDLVKSLSPDDFLIVNFDSLSSNAFFRNINCQKFWYSRRSFAKMGVMGEVQGTHFHSKRIHCNVNYHSEFKVNSMRIVGVYNRENLLASITACKALNVSDKSIQTCIEKFPGIPHRLEFVYEKNGVDFYNDSKSECMKDLVKSIDHFKTPVILIAGGKDAEEEYGDFLGEISDRVRVLVLVGECKERMNRSLGELCQTFIVGSFEESILLAYQKSRTGDVILLSPGNPSTDFFRDFEERGNYYKKLIYQI